LVERRSDGRLRVLDHKTGHAPVSARQPRTVGNGEVLQPLLYALAVEALLGQAPMLSRLSYSTLRGGYKAIDIPSGPRERAAILQVLAAIDQSIGRAFLPAAPRRDACKGCEYVPVCGPYEELRVTQKSQPELRDLTAIRRLR
jgi:CRISPR/Cas system-associated exonuclease Cas4 (RecB family)